LADNVALLQKCIANRSLGPSDRNQLDSLTSGINICFEGLSCRQLAEFGGVVGYRALAVDYTQDGPNKNNLDLILHGQVVGLSFRW
jgi:hypothetical protein